MTKTTPSYDFIVKKIRNKTFGLLDTVSPEEGSKTSGVSYGVSPPESRLRIYILTNQNDVKLRNIKHHPRISFSIPLCHRFICFLPFSTVYFESNGEIIPHNDPEAQTVFKESRILRKVLKDAMNLYGKENLVFIRLKPTKKALLYRPGLSFRSLFQYNERTYDVIKIPENNY